MRGRHNPFRRVPQHVARNQVARAVERARLEAAVRDYMLALSLAQDGAEVADELVAAATVMDWADRVCVRWIRIGMDPEPIVEPLATLRRGQAVLVDLRGQWRASAWPALDAALQAVMRISDRADARDAQEAWASQSKAVNGR